ncbi:DUF221-domain-containing protein [Pseudovirgaria hyperparasitica]|uniref:DUF221-domain-containing protein n=1 Tax=Pseudovirgaria hyperparasitica TaxID=470096 RepID=A0A6A6WLN0_9PEZI|nr:DUF221-domain-containing protein [Pseudovirgaria hyperparasitica]KAF2763072.1 DUF221-domain-containing protein [Pseudovirgaria hyperparasitica]
MHKQCSTPRWTGTFQIAFLLSTRTAVMTKSASLAAIIAAFVPSLITAIIFLVIFCLIRRYHKRIYAPRTYIDLISEKDRTPGSSTARIEWLKPIWQLGDKFVLEHSSLDAYLYLRFLKTIIFICVIGACITWPILFPVNATGKGNASQLDKLGFGNVHGKKRLYAHAVVAWVYFGFVMFTIARERMWLIGLRQAWHLSRTNASRLSSRTVLYLDPPKDVLVDGESQSTLGKEVMRQWVVKPTPKLDEHVGARNATLAQLESTELCYLKTVNKKRAKISKRNGSGVVGLTDQTISALRPIRKQYYVLGTESDAIDHLQAEATAKVQKVDEDRDLHSTDAAEARSAIFVEYATQSAAQRAYRSNPKSKIPMPANLAIKSKLIGVLPKEIIWTNITLPQSVRLSKKSAGNVFVIALIIFWSIPTAFIASISNVNYLAEKVQWLGWIKSLPDPILGLMVGLLPPLATSFIASYVPDILRYVAKMFEPTTVTAELQVQTWYYLFQIIQVFFVTALSSSATAFVPQLINNPGNVPMLLADKLPSSSNFYLTYFILQGLGSATKNILNYSDLFQYVFWDWFINKTPRDKYTQYTTMKGIGWGKMYPKFNNFVIIALAYSIISPLVLGIAAIGLILFYFCYRHQLLYVVQPKLETKGKCYTRALTQMLTGIYVGELALIGLFGLRKATGPSIMIAVLFFGTIAYNVVMNRYLSPLEDHFPDDLLAAEGEEEEPLLTAEEGVIDGADEHSRIQSLGNSMHIPKRVVDPVARFFEPHIYASHKVMKTFLHNQGEDGDAIEYTEDELKNAYTNPSLISKPATIWLPQDDMGLSKRLIEENEKKGLKSTDEGAWLDEKRHVKFDEDNLRQLPAWKKPIPF